ncbi:MAG: hypothetical protein CRN43_02930 [Candidatus Nephrothrix sp. EaCA]|nr:MAG: hypothetical protein CRN43_02930 [Candidatus Nephrothrix sp. EaCA]
MTITTLLLLHPRGKEGTHSYSSGFRKRFKTGRYTGRDSDCRDIPQPFSEPRHYEGALAMKPQGVGSRKYFLEITVGPGDRFSVRNYITTEQNFDKKYTIKAPTEGTPVPVIVKFIEACNACTPYTKENTNPNMVILGRTLFEATIPRALSGGIYAAELVATKASKGGFIKCQ